jgi:hypothetical protein
MTPYKRVMQNDIVSAIIQEWPGATVTMREPTEIEINGIMEAGAVGGEFLDGLGKTDLAVLSPDEYLSFVEKVIRAYENRCMSLYTKGDPNEPPF